MTICSAASSTRRLNVTAVTFSPDGSLIAAVSFNRVTVLDAASGETRFQTLAPNSASNATAFAGDGRYFATAGQDGIIRLWGVLPGQLNVTKLGAGFEPALLRLVTIGAASGKTPPTRKRKRA